MIGINNLEIVNLIDDSIFDIKTGELSQIKLELKDIDEIPELSKIISIERFMEADVYLSSFPITTQIQIGELYLKKDNYIRTREEKDYILWREFDLFKKEKSTKSIMDKFNEKETLWSSVSSKDKYSLIVIYFESLFRNVISSTVSVPELQILTDIDMNFNKFGIITSIQEFFFKSFSEFLKLEKGQIPFMNDIGSGLKDSIQTKNTVVRRVEVEYDINKFVNGFNELYGSNTPLIKVNKVDIINEPSVTGGDSWLIEINAYVIDETVIFRLEG